MLTSFGGYFHAGDDYVAVGGAERAVDHQQIAVADPRADHRVALDAHKVRGGRTLYQKFIQVKNIPPKKRQLLRVAEGRAASGTVRPATETPRSTFAVPSGARFTRGSPPKRSFFGAFPPNQTLLLLRSWK